MIAALIIHNNRARADHEAGHEPEMIVIEDLAFGVFGVGDNDSAHTLIIGADNVPSYSAAIIDGPITPQRGEYQLTRLTANTAVGVSIEDTTLSIDGLGAPPVFSLSNYTHNSPVTDANGDAILYIGATLSTSGDGSYYATGNYTGTMDVTLTF